MLTVAFGVEDLGVEMGGGMDPSAAVSCRHNSRCRWRGSSQNVAVDDLDHGQSAVVGHGVKGLGLGIGVLVGAPPQVVLGQFGVGGLLGLLGDGADGIGAIFGFLGAGDGGQAELLV